MHANPSETLAIGISARALFDLRADEDVVRNHGAEAYRRYQLEQGDAPLPSGPALAMLQALLRGCRGAERGIEIVVLSESAADASLRVLCSARHHDLAVGRAAFTGGEPLARYLEAFGVDLFLSGDAGEASSALEVGIAAALVAGDPETGGEAPDEIRIALDGAALALAVGNGAAQPDAAAGADAEASPRTPAPRWIRAVAALQRVGRDGDRLVRTALVCCEELPAREGVLRALCRWGIELDQAFFTEASSRSQVLSALRPHLVFDVAPDPERGRLHPVPTGSRDTPKRAEPRGERSVSALARLGLRS